MKFDSLIEDLVSKTNNMTLPIKYAPWHRFADWSDKGVFLPQEVLDKVNEEVFKKLRPKMADLNDEIRKTTGADLEKTAKSHRGRARMDTRNWRIWASSMKASRQENVYFIAGVPLRFWSFGGTDPSAGYALGSEVPELQQIPSEHGINLSPEQFSGHLSLSPVLAGFEWLTKDTAENFKLLEGLSTFSEWGREMRSVYGPKQWGGVGELRKHWNYVRFLMEKEQEMIDGKVSATT